MDERAAGRRVVRRTLLAAAGSIALAGCVPSPLIEADADRTPAPAPTLDDQRRSAAQLTATLVEYAAGCAAIPETDQAFAGWCAALAEQHRAHLRVLTQADPLGGVQADRTPLEQITPEPVTIPGGYPEAMIELAGRETELADLLDGYAMDRSLDPSHALLWVSQTVAARSTAAVMTHANPASIGPAPQPGTAVPAEIEAGTTAEARQVLLSRQRALVFGLQEVLGRISFDDPMVNVVNARLGEAMRERDQTAELISAAGQTPEAQPAEFEMPGDTTDPAQRDRIWGQLEAAVLAAWGRLGAVDAAGREGAMAQMVVQLARMRDRGTAPPHWPGWV